jgi:hypothetical protein
VVFAPPRTPAQLVLYMGGLGLGWLMWGIAYLVIIVVTRFAILGAFHDANRSPLDSHV